MNDEIRKLNKASSGKRAFEQGEKTESIFDDMNKLLWQLCGLASFLPNRPRRNKKGMYVEKGKFDRVGAVNIGEPIGVPVGIEIKSADGCKWTANKSTFPEHEFQALKTFDSSTGLAFVLVCEYKFKGGFSPSWRIIQVKDGDEKLADRDSDLWTNIEIENLPKHIKKLVLEKKYR